MTEVMHMPNGGEFAVGCSRIEERGKAFADRTPLLEARCQRVATNGAAAVN